MSIDGGFSICVKKNQSLCGKVDQNCLREHKNGGLSVCMCVFSEITEPMNPSGEYQHHITAAQIK